ncbi:MAG: LysR family transcriptional regulator substrate-binding protein [Trueperaceae bacterium]
MGAAGFDCTELMDMPLVLVADSECSVRLLAHLEAEGRSVGSTSIVRGNDVVAEMVAQGLGAAILPELAVDTLQVSVRTVPFRGPVRPIDVVLPPHGLKVPAVRALLRVVKERFPESGLPHFALEGATEAQTRSWVGMIAGHGGAASTWNS